MMNITICIVGVNKSFGTLLLKGIFYFICSLKKNLNSTHLCEFRINRHFHISVTGQQCDQKWRNLVRDYNVSKKKQYKLNIFEWYSNCFMIFRTFVYIVMESLKDMIGGWERVPVKESIRDLEQDFGRGGVIIKNFYH